jgi:hypothetical protein
MGQTFVLLSAAFLAGQDPSEPIEPPHQSLWTCSSSLRWHNRMTCHEVQDVSLPVLDCFGRLCARLAPRHRHNPGISVYSGSPTVMYSGHPEIHGTSDADPAAANIRP